MLKSCIYCGSIHNKNYICKEKARRVTYNKSKAGDLRNTYRWRKKRDSIKERDNYICQICKEEFMLNRVRIKDKELHVHHITPYKENEELFLDDYNLITLCTYHHEEAEAGRVAREHLRSIAIENNK
ncbi:MAG: HNH endonuclease [Serratia marcescens]|nr:HNH endonuclease [Serratia marcescens]